MVACFKNDGTYILNDFGRHKAYAAKVYRIEDKPDLLEVYCGRYTGIWSVRETLVKTVPDNTLVEMAHPLYVDNISNIGPCSISAWSAYPAEEVPDLYDRKDLRPEQPFCAGRTYWVAVGRDIYPITVISRTHDMIKFGIPGRMPETARVRREPGSLYESTACRIADSTGEVFDARFDSNGYLKFALS